MAVGKPERRLVGEIDPLLGAVRVVYGTGRGLARAERAQFFNERSPGMPPLAEFSLFGHSLAAGYFNADCRADLAVATPGANGVIVMYGSARGLRAAGATRFSRTDLRTGLGQHGALRFGHHGGGLQR